MSELNPIEIAWQSYAAGQLYEAAGICQRMVDLDEDDGHAWELLGLVYHDRGCFYEACDALERASLLVTVCPESHIALAAAYGALRRTELARDLYLQLMLRGGLSIPLMLQVAAGLESVDAPDLAMETCRRADKLAERQLLDNDQEVAQIHYDMSFYAARSGYRLHICESLVRKAIALAPNNVHYRMGLVSILIRLDRYEEAYESVCDMTSIQIMEVTCECCLERISSLLRSFGSEKTAAMCESRIRDLRASCQVAGVPNFQATTMEA